MLRNIEEGIPMGTNILFFALHLFLELPASRRARLGKSQYIFLLVIEMSKIQWWICFDVDIRMSLEPVQELNENDLKYFRK